MIEPIMSTALLDSRRANSLRQFPPKITKMKLFKTNSLPHVEDDILNGVGGAGGMEGAGGRASKVGGGGGSGSGATASRGSSSSGSSSQGVVGAMTSPAGLACSTQTLAVVSTPRSLSLASISSEGSADSHMVEREDIVALTTAVRAFREALGKLKKIFHPERDKNETLRVAAHERLGEVLRILRSILEKYSPIQHNELLAAASHLISHVNGYSYEDDQADPTSFLEAIDQLALAFSSRVSEYLMGDIDSSSAVLNCSTASSRNKSCENLVSSDAESSTGERGGGGGSGGGVAGGVCLDAGLKEPEVLTPHQIDDYLHRHEQGVEFALHRAKVWSKYAKDVMAYIEKRAQMDLEYARNLTKLAHTIRPALKDESCLPFQSIYCTALDQDIENSSQLSHTCTLLQTHKFIEPLTTRRNDHERTRKAIKETWNKELKRVQEAVANFKKSKVIYVQRQQELIKAREMVARAENTEGLEKLERKRDEAMQKAREAEAWYKACVSEANERHVSLLKLKRDVLVQTRELILQCDQTMKAVTVGYFQLQHTVAAPAPVQLQTLCESSRLYEPGSQYMEFVKRLGPPVGPEQSETPFAFQPYTPGAQDLPPNHDPTANGTVTAADVLSVGGRLAGGQGGSDTDSVGSSHSAKSAEASPTASPRAPARRTHTISSGDELETDPDTADSHYTGSRRQVMSKAAVTHTFRRLKTPSRCRECDSYVYFHGYECAECGLGCHKKCLETLAIQCGHKRLPRKMTTFGVDLAQHLSETTAAVPHLVLKCVAEIDARGTKIKGIYRVSGVKSRVEKLCQAFENGAHLVDLTDQHPNVIANVLKLYLRQLPEPLLTFRLYPEFIRMAKECPTGGGGECKRTTEELRELVRRLPRHHLSCLAVLMHHLNRVTAQATLNNMPSSNLGIVFGPTLLRTSEGSASLSSLVDTVHQTRAIELLIMFANEIFGPQELYQVPSVPATTRSQRLEEVLKPLPPSRQTSVQTSSSSSSSSSSSGVVNVPIAGYRRGPQEMTEDFPHIPGGAAHPAPTPPPQRLTKHRKDSDGLDEDWECESWEESGTDIGGGDPLSTSPRPPSALRTSAGQAKIYKTSLRDYVGLEGVELRRSSGVSKTECRDSPGVEQGSPAALTPPGHKVSPLLGHRSQRSGLTSGTDSSIDSDHSYDYVHHSHSLTPVAIQAGTHVLSSRGQSDTAASSASRAVSVSRDPSLDNVTSSVTSSDSSSQELDSAHVTEDSHSSEAADEAEAVHTRTLTCSSGCGGSSGGESGYVSPYLSTERGGLVTLGPSLLLTRATIAQYDTKRTITTVVAPKSSFDENRVRIQVPAAAAAAAGGSAGKGLSATAASSAVNIGAETTVTVSMLGQEQGTCEGVEGASLRGNEQTVTPHRHLHPEARFPGTSPSHTPAPTHSPSPDNVQEHPRRPSPNRSPRFV
ncbi:rho GTPase-activating protein 45-like isoform X5 [Panulirus ornatus]|uniref:rho GTPase-activating protein 45-like isoform X5 n=1 Tax=Panulirus ornatus TaxID=150431 RepID=UPI003A883D3F